METIIDILNMNVWHTFEAGVLWLVTSIHELKFWQLLAGIGLVFIGRWLGYRWSKR